MKQHEIQIGDVIFGYFGNEARDEAIAEIQRGYDNERMNHCAFVVSPTEVIEAVESGVRLLPIDRFIRRHRRRGRILIARTARADLVKQAITTAHTYIGFGYNHLFVTTPHKLYCSELIVEAFESASGTPLFQQYELVFTDEHGEIPQYWRDYYAKYDMDVPIGKGTHPASLSQDAFFSDYFWYEEEME